MNISKVSGLQGEIFIPGDKSITHRGIMTGAIANGTTTIANYLKSDDCISTINCFKSMGIKITEDDNKLIIKGKGLYGLKKPKSELNAGNSGTTTRILSGILSGQMFSSIITGDDSLQKRPMKRIIDPLSQMGADIKSLYDNNCVPMCINPVDELTGITYEMPIASAQVKSAILYAGMYASYTTSVIEKAVSRNHTELMLSYFGARIINQDNKTTIYPKPELKAKDITVPGDISSAAYFIVAGLITPNSKLLLKDVGINPTRDGILRVVKEMGGKITIQNERLFANEPVADILVESSELNGITIEGDTIPALIDEIPVIAVMAAFANGETVIKDAAELKTKESDRIETVTENLLAMGADVVATDDGMRIKGGNPLHGANINSYKDHRIAMAFSVAGLNASGITTISDSDCVDISYPGFYKDFQSLVV